MNVQATHDEEDEHTHVCRIILLCCETCRLQECAHAVIDADYKNVHAKQELAMKDILKF